MTTGENMALNFATCVLAEGLFPLVQTVSRFARSASAYNYL
jgi:hypothetical protein